jgi:ribosomal protein S18 acetylase RimI-like enzyme
VPTIRRASANDRGIVIALIREFYEIDRHPFDLVTVTSALEPLLVDDAFGQVWLIDDAPDAAEPVGYGLLTWGYSLESGGRDALVDELYVRQRGRGVGADALAQMLDAAAAAGARRAFLETESHNERVRAFYSRLGFRTEDSVWMSRGLSPSASAAGA